jgi:hypothetical protein
VDIRQYFRKLREAEAALLQDFPIVISLETSDGGKAGIASEVSRANAAKMIVEGRAVLATEAEAADYRARQVASREAFESADLARRVQVAIVDQSALAHIKDRRNSNLSGSSK